MTQRDERAKSASARTVSRKSRSMNGEGRKRKKAQRIPHKCNYGVRILFFLYSFPKKPFWKCVAYYMGYCYLGVLRNCVCVMLHGVQCGVVCALFPSASARFHCWAHVCERLDNNSAVFSLFFSFSLALMMLLCVCTLEKAFSFENSVYFRIVFSARCLSLAPTVFV